MTNSFESSYQANRYANVLMPSWGTWKSRSSLDLTRVVVGSFALNGISGLTIGDHGLSSAQLAPSTDLSTQSSQQS